MADLFFDTALLSGGWEHNVRVTVNGHGSIGAVEVDARRRGAESVSGIAVPGVPNAHSHAFQRAMSGLTERGSPSGDNFWTWRERMYAFLRSLEPDDVEAIASQLYMDMLRHGYTAVAEFHYLRNDPAGKPYEDPVEMGRRILSASQRTGIGMTLLPVLYRASDFGGAPPTEGQRRFLATVEDLIGDVAVLAAAAPTGNARVGLALHSLRAVTPHDLSVAVEAMHGIDAEAPIHIHAAEQLREVEACVAWSGARPVEWLLDHAPVDDQWCLIHATHMTDPEVAALAASGAIAGLCPTTEANLGDGVFSLAEYQSHRGTWAVGSDSNVSTSPAAELRMLEYAQRLTRRERNVGSGRHHRSTAKALLSAACDGGARASGRLLGRIEPGARADVVVLDPDHPTLLGRSGDEVLDSWIFAGDETPVRDVMVGGRWLVRGGRHVQQDEITAAYRTTVKRLAAITPQLAIALSE